MFLYCPPTPEEIWILEQMPIWVDQELFDKNYALT